ncbi:hypothetical protein V5O48_007974 [Marasmius crinis-equi]|uniref:SUN domain-containing protein n=1 Tax=Marasmius crinis-equi TaxID=585013 RepID=A0ABR3FFR6_9AGAR
MGTSIFNLPTALISLLLVLPVLAAPSSTNDPFHAISTHVRKEEPPICCLRPLEPLEPVDEEILLSFEEWKKKHRDKEGQGQVRGGNSNMSSSPGGGHSYTASNGGHLNDNGSRNGNVTGSPLQPPEDAQNDSTPEITTEVPPPVLHVEKVSPHFQVPLTDRFNYASLDCSARVHTSHRSAKSPSNILSSKRDRYLLSPCVNSKEDQFVVVELCDDIRIDTVQMANFEFFSGVFKDFSVSVAKTYIGAGTGKEGWVPAGTYRAKNIRGVQSFHPPTSLRDFYRFIRIDFHSHYSNEYYCPISLLRVYGLTHLEEWKWDTWDAESRDKVETSDVIPEEPQPGHTVPIPSDSLIGTVSISATEQPKTPADTVSVYSEGVRTMPVSIPTSHSTIETTATFGPSVSGASSSAASAQSTTGAPSSITTTPHQNHDNHDQQHQRSDTQVSDTAVTTTTVVDTRTESNDDAPSGSSSNPTTTITATASPSSLNSVATRAMPPATGGESIYRTIMNRLTAIEANQTLYAQYFEEQTCGVRDILLRLGEDIGRLEGIEKAQARISQRNAREWEKQRRRLEKQYYEMVSKVDYLSDEIVLEKRLGIAQLCLLLTVLIFMALTRGSRGENPAMHGPMRFSKSSMREWSRRHLSLSLSGDWVSRLTSSRSRSPKRESSNSSGQSMPILSQKGLPEASTSKSKSPRIGSPKIEPSNIDFPALASPTPTVPPRTAPPGVTTTPTKVYRPHYTHSKTAIVQIHRPRSRTPSLRSAKNGSRAPLQIAAPSTPTSRPRLTRANSHGGSSGVMLSSSISWGGVVGPVPKSAKKWARSAHLHEVKTEKGRGVERERERVPLAENPPTNLGDDKDSDNPFGRSESSSPFSPSASVGRRGGETDSDADVWEDTDIDTSTSVDGDHAFS